MANYMAWLAGPLKGLRLHASSLEMGIIATSSGAVYALCCLVFMRFSSRLPPRRTVLMGCAASVTTFLAASTVVRNIPSLICIVVVLGVTWALFWPPLMSWMSRTVPPECMSRELGGFNQSWCIGDMIGGLLAGIVSQYFSISGVYLCSAALGTVAFGLIWRRNGIRPESRGSGIATPKPATEAGENSPKPNDVDRRFIYVGWIGLGTGFLCLGCFNGLFPLIARERVAFSDTTIGLCFALMGLCQLGAFQSLKKWSGWHYQLWAAVIANALFIVALLILRATARPVDLFVTSIVCPIAAALCYTASIFYGATGRLRKSTAMSVHEGLLGGGLFVGGLTGGWLAKQFGIGVPFVVLSILLAAASLIQWRVGWYGHHRKETPQP